MRPAHHRAGMVVHDVVQGSGHARLLRLPQPQGPLLRRHGVRDLREGARTTGCGTSSRRAGKHVRGAGRAADLPAPAGQRRDGELLPDALDRLALHLSRGAQGRDPRGRRRLHGGRARLPHRRPRAGGARHQRDDPAPLQARPPPARHAAVGLLHAGRDGARPPAPRASGASTTPTTPTTCRARRSRQAFRDYYRYLDSEVGRADRGPRRRHRGDGGLRPRRPGHVRRHPDQRVADAERLPDAGRPARPSRRRSAAARSTGRARGCGPTAATTRASS